VLTECSFYVMLEVAWDEWIDVKMSWKEKVGVRVGDRYVWFGWCGWSWKFWNVRRMNYFWKDCDGLRLLKWLPDLYPEDIVVLCGGGGRRENAWLWKDWLDISVRIVWGRWVVGDVMQGSKTKLESSLG